MAVGQSSIGAAPPKASGNIRTLVAMVLYAALIVAALATLSDWRIRLVTVAIVLLFAGRTLWTPHKEAPSPVGREADREEEAADE
ncbi:MAG: hypothetical protein EPN33_04610 [Acidobacteria bacterium]|nr:MAG: hypothetical protein EPN33_04610 [Acidobacteriota bacterium]